MPKASEAGEHELRLVERHVGLLERVSSSPASGPPVERRPVLLGR
jgi:hypothetical protein